MIIDAYCKYVDKANQVRSYYDKMVQKLLFNLIQINFANSYIIYKKEMHAKLKLPLSSKNYKLAIIEYLLKENTNYQCYKHQAPEPKRSHLIQKTRKQRLYGYRKCKSRLIYECDTCKQALCPDCFNHYHQCC